MLTFQFFGNPDILFDRKSIADQFSSKSLALIAYLVVNGERSFSRDHLACLLWGQSGKEAAFSNLRYNLWSINKVVESCTGHNLLHTRKDKIQLREEISYESDVDALEVIGEADELQTLEQIKLIYKGDFLEGFYLKECLDFNDWVFYEREHSQRRFAELLNTLLDRMERKERTRDSIQLIEEMIKINPYDESLYVRAIRLLLMEGDRAGALSHYNRCVTVLREELNIAPSEETKAWLEMIKNTSQPPEEILGGDGRVISVSKERAREIIARIEKQKGIVLEALGEEGLDLPYYHLARWLEILYHERRDRIKALARPMDLAELSRLVPVYSDLVGGKKPDDCPDDMVQMRFFAALDRTLVLLAEEMEMALVVEQTEWLDPRTASFIRYCRAAFERDLLKVYCVAKNKTTGDE